MRITGGTYRGRRLQAPPGRATRPTGQKVREAVFTMLDARAALDGAVVADLFCGSGALGLEALSRGAAHVTFVDNSTQALGSVRDNCQTLGLGTDSYAVARAGLPRLPAFEARLTLVFLDPPYESDVLVPTLQALQENDALADEALLVCETNARNRATPDHFAIEREKRYGDTAVMLLAYHKVSGKYPP